MADPKYKVEVNKDDPNLGIVHTTDGAVDVEKDQKTGLWHATKTAVEDFKLDQRIKAQGAEDRGGGVQPPLGGESESKQPVTTATPDLPKTLQYSAPAKAPEPPSKTEAALRGFGQGASAYLGDEIAGLGAKLANLTHGGEIPRAAGRGVEAPVSDKTSFDVESAAQRAENAAAQKAHPYVYGGSNLAGNVALLAAPGGAARALAGRSIPYVSAAMEAMGAPGMALRATKTGQVLADVVGNTALGAGMSAAEAAPGQRLPAAYGGGLAGGYLGLLGHGVQAVLSPMSQAISNMALRQRASAALPKGEVTELEIAGGHPAVEETGKSIEQLNLARGTGPATPLRYAQNAREALKTTGPAVGAAVAEAKDKIVDLAPVRNLMQEQIDRLQNVMSPKAKREAASLQKQLNQMTAGEGEMELGSKVDFEKAYQTKQYFNDLGHTAAGQKKTVQAAQYRGWAHQIDEAMKTSLADDPELLAKYTEANANHSAALDLAKGSKAVAKSEGNIGRDIAVGTVLGGIGAYGHNRGEGRDYVSPALEALGGGLLHHYGTPRLPSAIAATESLVGRGIGGAANQAPLMSQLTAAQLAAAIPEGQMTPPEALPAAH